MSEFGDATRKFWKHRKFNFLFIMQLKLVIQPSNNIQLNDDAQTDSLIRNDVIIIKHAIRPRFQMQKSGVSTFKSKLSKWI